jgi:GTP cyclohydrolase I
MVTDILERLSGIAIVREKLADTAKRVDKMADWLLDHERRITTLEAKQPVLTGGKSLKKKR